MRKRIFCPEEKYPGGFTTHDGTIDFYLRVRSFLKPSSVVLDLGAGRAAWFQEDSCETRRSIRDLRSIAAEIIAADVDPIVMENETASHCVVIEDGCVPIPDLSVDVIICDFVCEHVEDPAAFISEVHRVLKSGGVFCARTPHSLNYVALAARFLSNIAGGSIIRWLQPERKEVDVFQTFYRLNSIGVWRRIAPFWESSSFIYRAEPAYYFGSRFAYFILRALHHILPSFLCGTIFVFLRKPDKSIN